MNNYVVNYVVVVRGCSKGVFVLSSDVLPFIPFVGMRLNESRLVVEEVCWMGDFTFTAHLKTIDKVLALDNDDCRNTPGIQRILDSLNAWYNNAGAEWKLREDT